MPFMNYPDSLLFDYKLFKNMNIKLEKYKKIIKFKKEFNLTDFDLVTNYGLFSGDTNLFKT